MVKLQGQSQDIASGFALIDQCSKEIQSLRENVDDYAHRIFEHSCRLTERSQIAVDDYNIVLIHLQILLRNISNYQ